MDSVEGTVTAAPGAFTTGEPIVLRIGADYEINCFASSDTVGEWPTVGEMVKMEGQFIGEGIKRRLVFKGVVKPVIGRLPAPPRAQ